MATTKAKPSTMNSMQTFADMDAENTVQRSNDEDCEQMSQQCDLHEITCMEQDDGGLA